MLDPVSQNSVFSESCGRGMLLVVAFRLPQRGHCVDSRSKGRHALVLLTWLLLSSRRLTAHGLCHTELDPSADGILSGECSRLIFAPTPLSLESNAPKERRHDQHGHQQRAEGELRTPHKSIRYRSVAANRSGLALHQSSHLAVGIVLASGAQSGRREENSASSTRNVDAFNKTVAESKTRFTYASFACAPSLKKANNRATAAVAWINARKLN
jgi:hypothetical protein